MATKPENCPEHIWQNATSKERQCLQNGHNWYFDTCSNCGMEKRVPDYIDRKHAEQRRYEMQKNKLAGGK